MSPSRLKLNSGKYNERENRSALYLDDEVLETNIPFLNSFRGNCYVSNSEKSHNLLSSFIFSLSNTNKNIIFNVFY